MFFPWSEEHRLAALKTQSCLTACD